MQIFFSVLILVLSATQSFGQDTKVIGYSELFQNLVAVQNGSEMDVYREGRALHNRTIVSVPAGTLTVKMSQLLVSDEGGSTNLVTTNQEKVVTITDTDGTPVERKASIRLMFFCPIPSGELCRSHLESLLQRDVEVQSTGVPNLDGLTRLPEKDLVFGFVLNHVGQIRR